MLTLRAGGNLLIEQYLTDAPTDMYSLLSTTAQPSWGMTLVAGADLKSANPTAVKTGTGNLTIGNSLHGVVVYSESGPIRLAAGRDVIVNSGPANSLVQPGFMIDYNMSYNVATYSGNISVTAGRDIVINGGVIQSAVR